MPNVPAWNSLPLAVDAVARRAGLHLNYDDLTAALGLSLAMTAVRGEPLLSRWCLHARDAFLPQTAVLFGIEVRELHPPEAAVGLSGFPEFRQHFDASYRPLIRTALRNRQPVLAWQGWSGGREECWGVIQQESSHGAGFEGAVFEAAGLPGEWHEVDVGLERPPVQFYVVERVGQTSVDSSSVVQAAVAHTWRYFSDAALSRFEVITGLAAYDQWLERIRAEPAGEARDRGLPAESRALATAMAEAHAVGARFWHQHSGSGRPFSREALEGVAEIAEEQHASMRAAAATVERNAFLGHVLNARAAAVKAQTALAALAAARNGPA